MLLLLAGVARGEGFDDVEIRTIPVAESVFMLEGRGGNIGVFAGRDGVFLVDDQFAPLTEKIVAAVARISNQPIRFVLNTHWHGDHTGGNENLGRAGALIVAHDNVRLRLGTEQWSEFLGKPVPPSLPEALPVVTFSETVTFHRDGQEIHVLHLPGAHTDGDAVVHFRTANVIHTGDLYFNGSYPYIDLRSGGSVDGMIAAADRVLALADAQTRIIPGHGPLSDRGGLDEYRKLLVAVRDRVKAAIAAGKSEDEVVAARPTEDFDDTWGRGSLDPERFTRIVYRSLAGQ